MSRATAITGRAARAAALRVLTLLLILLAVAGALGAVLVSPVALTWLPTMRSADWAHLSDVGQTYGAASAILSAAALIGVVLSLYYQRRETKAAREQALRGGPYWQMWEI